MAAAATAASSAPTPLTTRISFSPAVNADRVTAPAVCQSDWVVRLQCVPDAAAPVADALARRADTSWVSLTSGGTEIVCVVKPAEGHGRKDLLLCQLPSSRRIVAISAQSLLHMFRGGTEHWPGAMQALTADQAAMLSRPDGAASPGGPAQALGPDDRPLLAELARDGRASYAELAHTTHWHESTVRRRIFELRAAGVLDLDVELCSDDTRSTVT